MLQQGLALFQLPEGPDALVKQRSIELKVPKKPFAAAPLPGLVQKPFPLPPNAAPIPKGFLLNLPQRPQYRRPVAPQAPARVPPPVPVPVAAPVPPKVEEEEEKKAEIFVWKEKALKLSIKEIEAAEWVLNHRHMKYPIVELVEEFGDDVDKVDPKIINEICKKYKFSDEELELWSIKGTSPGSILTSVRRLVEYTLSGKEASPISKKKIRVIAKILQEEVLLHPDVENQTINVGGVLLLLRAHANACNVMKEVGIEAAFGMLTNSMTKLAHRQSLEANIFRVLRDFRYLVVHKLFATFKCGCNTHGIAFMTNKLSKDIGVAEIPDVHQSHYGLPQGFENGLKEKYFEGFYTRDSIVKHFKKELNEKRIPFQKLIKWFENHAPKDVKPFDFLASAMDVMTGEIHDNYLCYMLAHLDVFQIKQ